MKELYETLDRRERPEDVAQMVLERLEKKYRSGLRDEHRFTLDKAARRSSKRSKRKHYWGSSMSQDFRRVSGMKNHVAVARQLFETSYELSDEECDNPGKVLEFVQHISAEIHKTYGETDWKENRLDRSQRKSKGMDISKRRYNKLFRILRHMEEKLEVVMWETAIRKFTLVSKAKLAAQIPEEEFSKNVNSACFIAYYTARCNLRSVFTNSSQDRPYDEISDMLFQRCVRGRDTNWLAISYVYPNQEVLKHLSDDQKGNLLGRWFSILHELSAMLKKVWDDNDINRKAMVVRRGNDSSTWNILAGAWNKTRDGWIQLLYSLNLDQMLSDMCVGKVMRLIAGDVAWWHKSSGGDLHPDTVMWRELPLPWEVLLDNKTCTRSDILHLCKKHNVDAGKTGWLAPRLKNVAEYKPTPELVHGVQVSSPELASVLKKAGWFSGKSKSRNADVPDDVANA